MSEIADLFASLGLRVNQSEWAKGDAAIRKATSALDSLDSAASRMASDSKIARGRERDAARAARAIKQLEREEAAAARRAEAARSRNSALAMRAVSLDASRAAKAKKAADDKVEKERGASIRRAVQQAQVATTIIGAAGLYLGQRVVRAGIQFNATMEDSKNEVAAMLSLARGSDLDRELENANMLVDNLRERASKLPGTTMEYVQMLSMITQPLTDAKMGLKDLEDMTVNAVVAAKGLHVPWDEAARDIEQAMRGQFGIRDKFSSKVLGSIGYKGEEGRARFLGLTEEKRASEFKRGLGQRQFKQLGEAAGGSFTGVLSTLEDAWQHFQGMVAKPLFDTLKAQIKEINTWLEANKEAVEAAAKAIGEVLVTALDVVVGIFKFLIEHGDLVNAIMLGLVALMTAFAIKAIIALWPLYAIAAIVALIAYGIVKLVKHWDDVKDAARRAWEAIKEGFAAAFEFIMASSPVRALIAIIDAAKALMGLGTSEHDRMLQDSTGMSRSAFRQRYPQLNADADEMTMKMQTIGDRARGGGTSNTHNVTVGKVDVSVNAPNADPAAVAAQVGKHFDDHMGNMLRSSMDVVAP